MRAWLYAFAWLGGGIAAGSMAVWLITLVRYGWPVERASQQLDILAHALYAVIGLMGLVIFGLSMRNAIRNIKGTAGIASIEAESRE